MSMSLNRRKPARPDPVDVLLAIDAATLLARYPDASRNVKAPTPVDGAACYILAPTSDGIEAGQDGRFRVAAAVGARLRLRGTALGLRGEHAVLLSRVLRPQDARTLTNPSLVVDEDATIFVPQVGHPERPVARQAADHYWWMDVLAHGRGEFRVDIIVAGRDGMPMGCFRIPLAYSIVDRST
jgi:hypothetical protein